MTEALSLSQESFISKVRLCLAESKTWFINHTKGFHFAILHKINNDYSTSKLKDMKKQYYD